MWSECTHASEAYQDDMDNILCLFICQTFQKRKRRKWTGLVWQFISCHRVSDMLENTAQSKLVCAGPAQLQVDIQWLPVNTKAELDLASSSRWIPDSINTPCPHSHPFPPHPVHCRGPLLLPAYWLSTPRSGSPGLPDPLALFPKAFKCLAFPHHCVSNGFLWLRLFMCPPWCHTKQRGEATEVKQLIWTTIWMNKLLTKHINI